MARAQQERPCCPPSTHGDAQRESDVIYQASLSTGLLRCFATTFHVRRGQVIILDREDVKLTRLQEAIREAVRRAVQIEGGEALKSVPSSGGMIIISDQFRTILEVPLEGNADEAAQSAKPDALS